jgi:hypothetical protein
VQLIGQEVCAASCKHNTTRSNARAVLNSGDVQIVFLDTPGVVDEETAKKFKLGTKIDNASCNFGGFTFTYVYFIFNIYIPVYRIVSAWQSHETFTIRYIMQDCFYQHSRRTSKKNY